MPGMTVPVFVTDALIRPVAGRVGTKRFFQIDLILDSDIVGNNVRGNRVIFSNQINEDVEVTFDQIVLVDDATSRYYRLVVFCESGCYAANKILIDEIVDSLTVEG